MSGTRASALVSLALLGACAGRASDPASQSSAGSAAQADSSAGNSAAQAGTPGQADLPVRPAGDPGAAGSLYGAKMGGWVQFERTGLRTQIAGFAAAVSGAQRSHLFFVPDVSLSASTGRVYLSVVTPAQGWQLGTYANGLVGVAEIFSTSGEHFVLDLAAEGRDTETFRLQIQQAFLAQSGDHYYLTGKLLARLSNVHDPSDYALMDLVLNVPLDP